MRTLKHILLFTAIFLALSGCSRSLWLYQVDIEQGNVITRDRVSQLHQGMTKHEVEQVMGQPVLEEIFSRNRWNYVYTQQQNGGKIYKRRVTVLFQGNRVSRVIR